MLATLVPFYDKDIMKATMKATGYEKDIVEKSFNSESEQIINELVEEKKIVVEENKIYESILYKCELNLYIFRIIFMIQFYFQ